MFRRRFKPTASGGCEVRLPSAERELLRSLPTELSLALEAVAEASKEEEIEMPESLKRLFPPAYSRDEAAERRYRDLTRAEMLRHHSRALSTLVDSAGAAFLSEDEVFEWLTALNDLRLVLGTVLEVSDAEPELEAQGIDAESSQHLLYYYLGALEEELVSVISSQLPDPIPGADDTIPDDPWGEPPGGLRWDGTPQPPVPPEEGM